MRIVIAEESALVGSRLASLLVERIPGAEILKQARSAGETITAVRNLRPDALLLALPLPGGKTLDVLRAIKVDADPPVVVVLTTFGSPEDRKAYMAAGADFFVRFSEIQTAVEALRRLGDG